MVLDYFRQISSVPRGSGYNKKISDFIVDFAKKRNLKYVQDEALNVVIYKEAKGCENCPPLVFQGHMDMVCEKVNDSVHDFKNEGIQIIEEDGCLTAYGTTLGADDGIALAYMLALLDDDLPVHPPFEMVFTTDEEVGMLGAARFDATCLNGRHMINLDSEEEGIFIVSCAGGMTGKINLPVLREDMDGVRMDICVKNLLGGHSGTEIDKNRVNAVRLMGRLLSDISNTDSGIIDIHGGNKDNVIPNEAYMSIAVPFEDADKICGLLNKKFTTLMNELSSAEPDISFDIQIKKDCIHETYKVLKKDSLDKVMAILMLIPDGVHVMSSDISGMVESSSNLGVFTMSDTDVQVSVSMRSQKESYIQYISNRISILAAMVKASYSTEGLYPGWDLKKESHFRDMLCKVYERVNGKAPQICSIHAGLEGGVFTKKLPDMDIVSMGPQIYDIHTVYERLDINSAYRMYEFLKEAVREFALMDRREEVG